MAKTRSTPRFKSAATPIAVGALVLAGIGAAVAATSSGPTDPTSTFDQHSGDPVTYAHKTQSGGGGLPQGSAEERVVRGLGPSSPVKGVTVVHGTDGVTVTVNLSRNEDDPATEWVSDLAVGAIGELTKTTQATISDEFASATAVGPNRAGVLITTGLGVGAATLGQQFDSPSDAELKAHVADVATQFGMSVGSLEVLHPLESAIQVTFVVPNAASSSWTLDDLRTALVGSTPNVEGAMIELDTTDGEPLLRAGSSYRTANGILWFAPGQDERFGAGHGSLDSAK